MKMSDERLADLQKKFPPEYPYVMDLDMIPVADVDWADYSQLKELTCKNHPWSRYLTKDPFQRGLHFIQGPNGLDSFFEGECPCPFSDLYVVLISLKK